MSDVAWQTSASCPFPSITFVTIMTRSLIPWLQSNECPFTPLMSLSYITRLQLLGRQMEQGVPSFFPPVEIHQIS